VASSLFSACARRTLPPASAATRTSSFGQLLPPTRASSIWTGMARARGVPERRAACAARSMPSCRSRNPALQVHRRDARASRTDLEYRPEPHLKRLVRSLQQRARRQTRLVAAFGTLEQDAITRGPHAGALVARAGRLAAPSRLDPVPAVAASYKSPTLLGVAHCGLMQSKVSRAVGLRSSS
jgi:hypothetical protein